MADLNCTPPDDLVCGEVKFDQDFIDYINGLKNTTYSICEETNKSCIDIPTTLEVAASSNIELVDGDLLFSPRIGAVTTASSPVGDFRLQILGTEIEFTDLLGSATQPVFRGEVISINNRSEQVQLTLPQVPDTLVITFGSINSTTGNYFGESVSGFSPAPSSVRQIPRPDTSQGEYDIEHIWNNLNTTTITFTVNTGDNVYGIWNAIGMKFMLFSVNGTERISGFKRVCRDGTVSLVNAQGQVLSNATEVCCADL